VFGRLTRAKESIPGGYLPLGLSRGARLARPVTKDSFVTYRDVEMDETLFSLKMRRSMEEEFMRSPDNPGSSH
jgi:predicted homoserine dehydrogenase-like protein